MIHLRIVTPPDRTERVQELLFATPSVVNIVWLQAAARKPEGDLILCDVAREDASVVVADLKELGLHEDGSIAMEVIDTHLSRVAREAEEVAVGAPSDAVVWEQVEASTSHQAEFSGVFMTFMVLACLIAAVGIFLDSAILVVGAMVVGPEFGPIAGFCVACVQRRGQLAVRSLAALAVGFPLAMTVTWLTVLIFKATDISPETFSEADHSLSTSIANPDFFAFFVAMAAGAAGMLSLSTAKSGALIGVLISVTTIPAAANVAVAAAYADADGWRGSLAQLLINIAGILVAGIATLYIQRLLYRRRRIKHLRDRSRELAGLPVGRSLHRRAQR